jgi:hypothetical protein
MRSKAKRQLTTRRGGTIGVIIAVIAAMGGFGMARASAAPPTTTFNVNTVNDTNLLTVGGTTCVDTASSCSLRAATQAANNLGGTVIVNVPAGTYNLNLQRCPAQHLHSQPGYLRAGVPA